MFLSHPNVCSPIQETLQIFNLDIRSFRYEGLKVALLSRQIDIFNQWRLESRKLVSLETKKYIDTILYDWKLKTLNDSEMVFKYENIKYNLEEIKKTRLVIKNNNALIYLTDIFLDMYPDAIFIALIRHPIALYESHKRRRTPVSNSPEKFYDYYNKMITKINHDAKNNINYHIVKFEDLVLNPLESIEKLYEYSNLDFSKLNKIRFKAKAHAKKDGSYGSDYDIGKHYWLEKNQTEALIDSNVNSYQMENISKKDKNILLRLFKNQIKEMNYSLNET
tara:strand:+ start:465 stop:1298 length:834 start_codon:yes stop_codon:yes gene_type:complete